jgi:hypothetical protein
MPDPDSQASFSNSLVDDGREDLLSTSRIMWEAKFLTGPESIDFTEQSKPDAGTDSPGCPARQPKNGIAPGDFWPSLGPFYRLPFPFFLLARKFWEEKFQDLDEFTVSASGSFNMGLILSSVPAEACNDFRKNLLPWHFLCIMLLL